MKKNLIAKNFVWQILLKLFQTILHANEYIWTIETCSCINTQIELQCYIIRLADTEFTPYTESKVFYMNESKTETRLGLKIWGNS